MLLKGCIDMSYESCLEVESRLEIEAKIVIKQVFIFFVDDKRRCSWNAEICKFQYQTRKDAELQKEKINIDLKTKESIKVGRNEYSTSDLSTSETYIQTIQYLQIGDKIKKINDIISQYEIEKFFTISDSVTGENIGCFNIMCEDSTSPKSPIIYIDPPEDQYIATDESIECKCLKKY